MCLQEVAKLEIYKHFLKESTKLVHLRERRFTICVYYWRLICIFNYSTRFFSVVVVMRRYSPPYYSPPRRGYGGRGRSPPPLPPPRRGYGGGGRKGSLLVRNIPLDCRPEELRVPFERFGPVRDVYIPTD